jgi:RimJ/RimL family protein N-acetyltransferase
MTFQEFIEFHLPALEADEVRFNLPAGILAAADGKDCPTGFLCWTLGGPGHCAIQSPDRPIVLGALNREECQRLARETKHLSYPGVIGTDSTARWFVEEALALGIAFQEPEPQRIYALRETPRYPHAEGAPSTATVADMPLLFDWMLAFRQEAVPHDLPPQWERVEKMAASGRFLFWKADGEPVALAGIARELKTMAAIGPVYTPPARRNRGFAGAATAALCERLFAVGKSGACLYTDLRNPYSNRCYAKVGFKPHCDSYYYLRAAQKPAER